MVIGTRNQTKRLHHFDKSLSLWKIDEILLGFGGNPVDARVLCCAVEWRFLFQALSVLGMPTG